MKKYNVEVKGIWNRYNEEEETGHGFVATITLEAEDAEAAISAARNINLFDREAVKVKLVELAEDE